MAQRSINPGHLVGATKTKGYKMTKITKKEALAIVKAGGIVIMMPNYLNGTAYKCRTVAQVNAFKGGSLTGFFKG